MSRRNLKGGAGSARSKEVSTIPMQVDLRVHDDVALGEIELYAEVLATVAASDGPLSKSELDEALGIRHRRSAVFPELRLGQPSRSGCGTWRRLTSG